MACNDETVVGSCDYCMWLVELPAALKLSPLYLRQLNYTREGKTTTKTMLVCKECLPLTEPVPAYRYTKEEDDHYLKNFFANRRIREPR